MAEQTKLETVEIKLESIPTTIEEPNINSTSIDKFQVYRVLEQLPSKGAESDIYIIQKDKKNYLLKLYRLGIEPKKEILDDLQRLSQKYYKDLVKIYDTGFDDNNQRWYEIQEYLEYGSLRDFKDEIDTEKLYEIIQEILSILNTLHSNKIIHRDIKPENILIRSYEPLDLVITDFGISSLLDDATNIWTTIQGSYKYFAPESFAGVIGKAVDYWSFGMIIYELANGKKHYFDGISNDATIQLHITTKEIEIPSSFDENIKIILGFLFRRNPEYRGDYKLLKRWLDGEDIGEPRENEKVIEAKDGYPFNGKKYNNFKALAKTVSNNYKNWTLWGDHLENNHVMDWCNNNKQYDKHTLINNIKDSNKDLMVLRFVYTFNSDIKEFRVFGKAITINNLHLFVQNYLNNSFSEEEQKIYQSLIGGKIEEYHNEYLKLTKSEDSYGLIFNEIANYIKKSGEDGLSKRVVFRYLDFLNHQNEYLLPTNREKITINNFNYFIKKVELDSIGLKLDSISLDESKKLKKLISINRDDYYFPNDFFQNLEENFSDTISNIKFFIKKTNIIDIEKRYYITSDSPYSKYIEDIKDSPLDIYIQNYNNLKTFKKNTLLLNSELEKAKEQKELFLLFNIDIERPLTHQLPKIKKILRSNIDIKTYQKIESINKKKVYRDFSRYISNIEDLNIKLREEDRKIIDFIQNYRWKLYTIRTLFILTLSSILIAVPFFKPYLISFIISFTFIILSFILLVNSVVKIDIALLNRIGKITDTHYKTKKKLSNRLIVVDNILLKFTIFLLSGWILYYVIPIFIDFMQFMGSMLLEALRIGA